MALDHRGYLLSADFGGSSHAVHVSLAKLLAEANVSRLIRVARVETMSWYCRILGRTGQVYDHPKYRCCQHR